MPKARVQSRDNLGRAYGYHLLEDYISYVITYQLLPECLYSFPSIRAVKYGPLM
jgi:hypothetical protein